MPYYEVQVTRTVTHITTVTVEVDDEDEAENAALARAEDPENKALEWDFEDETFSVDNIDEVDEPESDPEEAA